MARYLVGAAIGLGFLLAGATAGAEELNTITSKGTAFIDKVPEILRLTTEVSATAPDAEQALAKLNQAREAAVNKLKELGAAADDIRLEGPRPPSEQTPSPFGQSVRVVNGRVVMSAQEDEEDEDSPPKVALVMAIQADWKLKAKDAEGVVREFLDLKAKIKAADLNGLSKKEKDEAKEEEEDEHRPTVSPPVWRFVCRISDAEQARLVADAYAQAKSRAERLAAAAGMKLGPLASLDSRDLSASEGGSAMQTAALAGSRFLQFASGLAEPAAETSNEAVGTEPHKIRWGVQVTTAHHFAFPPK